MLKLHGFAASNYYNVAKIALLEKGLQFEEALTYVGAGPKYRPEYLEMSPVGKVPCLQTEQGFISESRVIVTYLDARFPDHGLALFPSDPFERAKHDELYQVLELYLELTARRLIPTLLVGVKTHDSIKREVQETVEKGLTAMQRLGRFEPYLTGPVPRAVDFAAALHWPVVSAIMRQVIGSDALAREPFDTWLRLMQERPHMQRVRRDAEADAPAFRAHLKQRYG